jgi:hypothetical protein
MFGDLRSQLGAVEARLRGVLADGRGKLAARKAEAKGLGVGADAPLRGVERRLKETEGRVGKEFGAVRASVKQLTPPP